MPREEQQIIAATLLRRSFDGRVGTAKQRIGADDEQYLPAPVFTLIEEAHHFAPAGEEVPTTNLLKQILAEGRKFGFAVGLISQRPGKLDQDVLSQCHDAMHPAGGESRRPTGHRRRRGERWARVAGRAPGPQQRAGDRGGGGGEYERCCAVCASGSRPTAASRPM